MATKKASPKKKKTTTKKKTVRVSRSSKTGKFVTKKYAKKHPNTTENENIKVEY